MSINTIPFATLDASQNAVIIDDTDPTITYTPTDLWSLQTVDISNSTHALQYGTSHVIPFHSGPASFTFTFTGIHILAFFSSNETGAIASCTLDDQPMTIELTGFPPAVQCFSKQTIQYGIHNVVVTATPNFPHPLSFDYLAYVPTIGNISVMDLDVGYGNLNPLIQGGPELISPGASLDLNFIGYSLSIYSAFSSQSSYISSPGSYSIDGNAPVNFTIHNQATNVISVIDSAIVVQTPRYSLGQHHFHLDFWGDHTTVPLNLEQIIIQNISTPYVLLDPFPPMLSFPTNFPSPFSMKTPTSLSTNTSTLSPTQTPTSSPTQPLTSFPTNTQSLSPTQTHRTHGSVIGGATAGGIITLLLLFLTFFIYRRRRLSASNQTEGSHLNISPFETQDPPQYMRYEHIGEQLTQLDGGDVLL